MTSPIFTHDPEFPFLLVARGGKVIARFAERWHAVNYSQLHGNQASWKVVDTTPTPRIPVDAQFITWARYQMKHFAYRYRDLWVYSGRAYTQEELLQDWVGDAEITVLDPRKES